jgi:hypothetical protein
MFTDEGFKSEVMVNTPTWAARLAAIVVLLVVVGACGADQDQRAARGTPSAQPTATPPQRTAAESARARRQRADALYRSAKRALERGHYRSAKRLAIRSRRLRKTQAARTVLASANAGIAKAEAAARERKRLARIARDARTCTATEKAAVREGASPPPAGCADYAAERAAAAAEKQEPERAPDCDPNYEGACLKPDSPDYDCAGGSGDGPDYTGPVTSVGSDPYDLDRDGDGSACESS